MLTRLFRKFTQTTQSEELELIPSQDFWFALDLVMGQYLSKESRRHDGPSTDTYEHCVANSLCTLDYWCSKVMPE